MSDFVRTPNYQLYKPVTGADEDQWGTHWNSNADTLDNVIHGIDVRAVVTSWNTRVGAVTFTQSDLTAVGGATTTQLGNYLPLVGGTLTGQLTLAADPASAMQAATKQYVDSKQFSVSIGDAAPASPSPGALWWDSVAGQLYIRYQDPDSTAWIIANSAPISSDAPSDAKTYARRNAAWTDVSAAIAAAPNNQGRSYIHNGGFTIAQRGNGPWTASGYTVDRWRVDTNTDTISTTRQAATDAICAAIGDESCQYFLQHTFTGTSGAAAFNEIVHKIEGLRRLSGKTVTLSFWAWCASGTLSLGLSGYVQYGTGGSPSAAVNFTASPAALTTTPQRFSRTFNIQSSSGKTFGTNGDDHVALQFWGSSGATNAPTAGIGVQSGTIALYGVMLEVGSGAGFPTPYIQRDPNDELQLCRRFYQTWSSLTFIANAGGPTQPMGQSYLIAPAMRATPTFALSGQSYTQASGLTVANQSATSFALYATSTASGGFQWTTNLTATADL